MCGLVGFFVGCDVAIACPKRRSCEHERAYRSAFGNWDQRAAVRQAPRRVDEAGPLLFPEAQVPVMKHRKVRALDPARREALQRAALFRFLNFTHKLEMVVVNTVTANIALGRYDVGFPDDMRLDAHRIYVDEAYHALFSFEMMREARAQAPSGTPLVEDTPAFLRRTDAMAARTGTEHRALIELMAVVISEMLITSTLHGAARARDMDAGVSAMMSDHARDEARHHAFYRQVLLELWPRLSERQRSLVLDHVYPLLLAYTAPDRAAIEAELTGVGLPAADAREVFEETYDRRTVSDYALACGRGLLDTFDSIAPRHESERVSERFATAQTIEEVL